MKVFMLGWEFPPYISGGLGTACYGLTKALDEIGVEVAFVLPTPVPSDAPTHVKLRTPQDLADAAKPTVEAIQSGEATQSGKAAADFEHVEFHRLPAVLQPYGTPTSQREAVRKLLVEKGKTSPEVAEAFKAMGLDLNEEDVSVSGDAQYAGDLMGQVYRYARLATELAENEAFDVIHAHDWMTYPAALAVAAATRKPLVIQVHSTEFDRSGENVNQQVYEIERTGMHCADKVICVSHLTRNIVASRYGVALSKLAVVYNAVEIPAGTDWQMPPIRQNEKIVLFLGRVTMQKGPEYFLRAARKVVDKFKEVRFILAGSGDMMARCVQEVADLKLGRHVTFTGFLRGDDVAKVFSMADLYVMPSVSEPFGIAPLEALSHNVPVIISKQSGVSEVLSHVLKVDFWDIDEMANKILAVLKHAPLQRTLRQHGHFELRKLSWRDSAVKLSDVYNSLVNAGS